MSCLILNITKKTSENKIDRRGTKKNVLIDHGKEYIMVAELGNRTLDGGTYNYRRGYADK